MKQWKGIKETNEATASDRMNDKNTGAKQMEPIYVNVKRVIWKEKYRKYVVS